VLLAKRCALAIDFGSGVFSHLRSRTDPAQLDAVVISHMHADHFFDLVPLRYALKYELRRSEPLPVFLPPDGARALRVMGNMLASSEAFFDGIFEIREYIPHDGLTFDGCAIRFAETVHYIPAYAMRIEVDDAVLTYSADTAPCDAVAELARDADIFLCEAALGALGKEYGRRGHMSADEAGELARRAEAKRLVLTHYGAGAEPSELSAAAARYFSGEITVADDGMDLSF